MQKRIAILGASRGLGAHLALQVAQQEKDLLLVARKKDLLQKLKTSIYQLGNRGETEILAADFSKSEDQNLVLDHLRKFNPTHIFYVAGGGPYGPFGKKNWKDHQWAFKVGFLFPSQVIHWALGQPQLQQLVLVGSAIAESKGDPLAASYSASKHALVGLYKSIVEEGAEIDLRLYSPGYMDTELLPMNSWPRENGEQILSPQSVAEDLFKWSLQESARHQHRCF